MLIQSQDRGSPSTPPLRQLILWSASFDSLSGTCGPRTTSQHLIAGDSDLAPAIAAARDAGVVVTRCYSEKPVHKELLQNCDERVEITRNVVNQVKSASAVAPAPSDPQTKAFSQTF